MIGNIDFGDNATARQNLGELNGHLGDLARAIVPAGCTGTPSTSPSWPILSAGDSKIRAMQMLREVEDGLNVLQGRVLECAVERAKGVFCQVVGLVGQVGGYYD